MYLRILNTYTWNTCHQAEQLMKLMFGYNDAAKWNWSVTVDLPGRASLNRNGRVDLWAYHHGRHWNDIKCINENLVATYDLMNNVNCLNGETTNTAKWPRSLQIHGVHEQQ